MAMAAGMFVIGCFGPLIAIYVRESLHASAGVFGIVSAMVGVGMLVGHAGQSAALRTHAERDGWCWQGSPGSASARSSSALPHVGRASMLAASRSASRSRASSCRRRR